MRLEFKEDPDKDATCAICDEKPDAAWYAATHLYIYSRCAVEILPKLIADAIFIRPIFLDDPRQVLVKITAHYWEGIASRLASHIRKPG